MKVEKEVATEEEVAEVATRIQTLMLMVSQLLRKDLTSLREAEVAIEVAEVVTEVEEKVVIDPTLKVTEAVQDHPEEAEVKLEEKTSLSHLKPRERLKLKNESAAVPYKHLTLPKKRKSEVSEGARKVKKQRGG